MEIAMNKRAANALFAGATWGFYTHSFAGEMNGNIAIQDLTLKSDPEFAATLSEAFVQPSIEKLKVELGGGVNQLKAVFEKFTDPDNTRKWFEPGACFAAGTLVHTKEGLVPIEQIKVGDFVLSRHDSGTGKRAYKRVLNTFAHEPQRVIRVEYIADPAVNRVTPIVCTVNHPFWVKGLSWTPAEDLYRSSRENMLETANGRSLQAHGTVNIYISDQPGVGWLSAYDNDTEAFGFLWDFINNRFVAADVVALDKVQHHQIPYNDPQFGTFPQELYLHLPVYNLEVEDFHTYYVGEHGIWVHNTNCGGRTSRSGLVLQHLPLPSSE